MTPDQRLVDAVQTAKENPDTFQLPPDHRLEMICEGVYVKVCLNSERFWVKVSGDPVDGVYPAVICNDVSSDVGRVGDKLCFELRHVYDTLWPHEAPK